MDEEFDWIEEMIRYDEIFDWFRVSIKEVNVVIVFLFKKLLKDIFNSILVVAFGENEKRRGRNKGKKFFVYIELDDEIGEFFDVSFEDRNGYLVYDEEVEIGEYEDEEEDDGVVVVSKDVLEEDGFFCDGGGYDYFRISGSFRIGYMIEEFGFFGLFFDGRRMI